MTVWAATRANNLMRSPEGIRFVRIRYPRPRITELTPNGITIRASIRLMSFPLLRVVYQLINEAVTVVVNATTVPSVRVRNIADIGTEIPTDPPPNIRCQWLSVKCRGAIRVGRMTKLCATTDNRGARIRNNAGSR